MVTVTMVTKRNVFSVGSSIFGRILNAYTCRPEVATDIIYGVTVACTNVEVRVKFGDFRLNRDRII